MMLPPTVSELNALPEHWCDVTAHTGDLRSPESAITEVNVVAKALERLIRGGHVELDQTNTMFRWLVNEIERKKSGNG